MNLVATCLRDDGPERSCRRVAAQEMTRQPPGRMELTHCEGSGRTDAHNHQSGSRGDAQLKVRAFELNLNVFEQESSSPHHQKQMAVMEDWEPSLSRNPIVVPIEPLNSLSN